MKFVLIFGPSAVGKATVGKALAQRTGLKLFHNHLSIEAVVPVFDFGTPQFNRLVSLIRFEVFKEVAKSDLPGVIFTLVWALDLPEEHQYVDRTIEIFKKEQGEVYYVELETSLDIRLHRNKQEDRLLEKPSKRNISSAEKVLHHETKYQLNTRPGEFNRMNHLKINNENLDAETVAEQICQHFAWE